MPNENQGTRSSIIIFYDLLYSFLKFASNDNENEHDFYLFYTHVHVNPEADNYFFSHHRLVVCC